MIYQWDHFGESEHFCKEYGENLNFPLHLHGSFEFITVSEGEMKVTVDGRASVLRQGECMLIFPNQLHEVESRQSRHMLCIFSPELVKAYALRVAEKKPTENVFFAERFLVETLDRMPADASVIEKKGVLYSLCARFDRHAEYHARSNADSGVLYQIFRFVEQHHADNCTLAQLARQTGYSNSYLSRCFKRATGISYNTYVNQYRISNACYLLSNTDLSVLQCALECGYGSLRSFNRNFLSLTKTTPREYKTKKSI